MQIETDVIVAKTRKLKAIWTYETQQDLIDWHLPKEKHPSELKKKRKYRSIDDPWKTYDN